MTATMILVFLGGVCLGAALFGDQARTLVRTFVRERLYIALFETQRLLDSHGLEKHGRAKWRTLSTRTLRAKAQGHLLRDEIMPGVVDDESQLTHATHAAVRCLQLVQRLREERDANG